MAETFERLLNSYLDDTSSDPDKDKVEKVKGFIKKNQAFVRHELPTGVKSNFKTNVQLSLHGFPYDVYLATKNNTVATTKGNGESYKNGKLDYVARLCEYMNAQNMTINGKSIDSVFWVRKNGTILSCFSNVSPPASNNATNDTSQDSADAE